MILVLLYHAIIASSLTYGVSTWGLTYPSLLEPIAILQKKIMRSVTFNENTAPSTPIFDTLQILKFNDVILLQITSFVYECVNNLAPVCFRVLCASETSLEVSIMCTILVLVSQKEVIYLLYDVISLLWCSALEFSSQEIRSSNSLSNFKKKAESYLLSFY